MILWSRPWRRQRAPGPRKRKLALWHKMCLFFHRFVLMYYSVYTVGSWSHMFGEAAPVSEKESSIPDVRFALMEICV